MSTPVFAALLRATDLDPFRGHPSLPHIHDGVPPLVQSIVRGDLWVVYFVPGSFQQLYAWDVHVPLHTLGRPPYGQQWHPRSIENLIWGSPAGMPSALDSIDTVGGHSGHVVPVLVDENIQYRIMRYLCSQSYPPYDVSRNLAAIVYASCMNTYATTCTASAAMYLPSFLTGSSGPATLGTVAMKTEVGVHRTPGDRVGRQARGTR